MIQVTPARRAGNTMKSYSLQNVASIESAVDALREALPGQEAPWLLLSKSGDVIAYFSVSPGEIDVAGPAKHRRHPGTPFAQVLGRIRTERRLAIVSR
jgi:hypothetical protein